MEALLLVAEHRNQYCGRVKSHGPNQVGSSPSRHFREINCRTFQSGTGILPAPFRSPTPPISKHTPSSASLKTPPPTSKSQSVVNTGHKTASKSSPIPINIKTLKKETSYNEELGMSNEKLLFSELWAGPAYSNSPPPSCLPIPKFSMRPKRTVSLDLPASGSGSDSDIEVHPFAKSAPPSPTREHHLSTKGLFSSADSATKNLRRILKLDAGDD